MGKQEREWILLDELHHIDRAESTRIMERLARRSRHTRPPSDLPDAEAYRAWLAECVTAFGMFDVTEAERDETRQWQERIAGATVEDLWTEYVHLTVAP